MRQMNFISHYLMNVLWADGQGMSHVNFIIFATLLLQTNAQSGVICFEQIVKSAFRNCLCLDCIKQNRRMDIIAIRCDTYIVWVTRELSRIDTISMKRIWTQYVCVCACANMCWPFNKNRPYNLNSIMPKNRRVDTSTVPMMTSATTVKTDNNPVA